MEQISNLTHPPIIGETYLVPCVEFTFKAHVYRKEQKFDVPILGPAHDDSKFFPVQKHYHKDVRFMSNKLLDDLGYTVKGTMRTGLRESACGRVELLPMKCRRKMPVFEVPIEEYPEPHILQRYVAFVEAYKGTKLNCGKCPHRGHDLSGEPIRKGMKVCPMHGLRFDAETGEALQMSSWPDGVKFSKYEEI